jgi:sugar phosphate isomerase/epimerase
MVTRREFGKAAVAGVAGVALAGARFPSSAAARIDSTIEGVKVGAITYSFRDMPRIPGADYLEVGIRGCVDCGIGAAELWATMAQPQTILPRNGQYNPTVMDTPEMKKAREEMRRWRINTPMSYWQGIRKRFDNAGIELIGYSLTLADDFSDEELDKTFQAVRAMGISHIGTNQMRVAMGKRAAPFAEKYRVTLGFHNHTLVDDPNEIASIESFQRVMDMSPFFKVNLDIGHFTAANLDAVDYIRKHHRSITYLHLKDRKRDNGANQPWGHGDTPVREVLQLIKKERYPIPAVIEYEYMSDRPAVDEVKRCMEFIREALRS